MHTPIIKSAYINMQNKFIIFLSSFLLVLSLSGCTGSNQQTDQSNNPSSKTDTTKVKGSIYERAYSPSFGPDSAKVTIVEFFDPACEACRAFYPVVKEIMNRHAGDVRVVLRYATFHQGSETVVRILEVARTQNVFEPVLEALLKDQQQWASHDKPNIDRAWELAEEAGLDKKAAKSNMNSDEINAILKQEKEDIRSLQISQTPTFFVNGKPLPSFGVQQLYELVVTEIAK